MLKILVLTTLFCINRAGSVKKVAEDSDPWKLSIHMPAKRVLQDEQHVCYAKKVTRKGYATAFLPTAHGDRVHHLVIFGCLKAFGNDGEHWVCDQRKGKGPCESGFTIIYVWARNAPALYLPHDVGTPIGFPGGVEYLVLQVHYAKKFLGNLNDYSGVTLNINSQQPRGISAVYLFIAGQENSIPARKESVLVNMSCPYIGDAELHVFAFRTHTHDLGVAGSVARQRNGKWDLIGKRNPIWPQVWQKISPEDQLVLKNGDLLASQCLFNTTTRDEDIGMETFTIDNVLQTREAIEVDTVVTVDSSTGSFISSWGKNRFYMPQGITVDSSARVWITDAGLHQVLRFGLKEGVMTEERVWGERFVPGNSRSQFCKPTSVAVASDGSFFVADGYCNSRIVHFDKDGSYLNEYGTQSQGNTIIMIPGRTSLDSNDSIAAFAASPSTRRVTYSWQPQSGTFLSPNILRVSLDCRFVYVGELGGVLWKFEIESDRLPVTPIKIASPRKPTAKQSKPVSVEETKQIVYLVYSKPSIQKVVLDLTTRVGIPAFLILLICACVRFRKRGGRMGTMNMLSVSVGYFENRSYGSRKTPSFHRFDERSQKGFHPSNADDMDNNDDLDDDSDRCYIKDTLYLPKRNYESHKA